MNTGRILVSAFLAVPALTLTAQLTVQPQPDLIQLARTITGPGVTILNPEIHCNAAGFGEFAYSGSIMSIQEGVILTTGRISDAVGPNNVENKTFQANTPGSPILNTVTGRTTYDACRFEFDIIPSGDSLEFNFVFASEEYNEWVGSQYNDVFGFFISGPGIVGDPGIGADKNIALIPNTTQAVAINNVNNGSNQAYYHDNVGGQHIQYDGFTKHLKAVSAVQPCQTYRLKLIVADASDRKFDSGVFIERIRSSNVTMQAFTANGTPELVEGCNPGHVRFTRSQVTPQPLALQYFLHGTATNGVDYTAIGNPNPNVPKTVTIPANQAFADVHVTPLADALPEPTEHLLFILGNPNCPAAQLDTLVFPLVDTLIASMTPGHVTICQGDSVQYTIVGDGTVSWSPASGVRQPNAFTTWVAPNTTTTYQITVANGSCSRTFNRQVRVSQLAVSANVIAPLCHGATNGAIDLSVSGSVPPVTYSWSGPNGFTATTQDITGIGAGTYTVTVTDAACTRVQSFQVIAPAALSATLDPTILAFGQNIACHGGQTGSIATTITGGTGPFQLAWTGPNGFQSNLATIGQLGVGLYTLQVTDANGCLFQASTALTEPPAMSATLGATSGVQCFGDGLGSATVSVAGGIPPYAYAWNSTPVQTNATATALPSASYLATITDSYGCTAQVPVIIPGPTSALSTSLGAITHVGCHGAHTGTASVVANGGTAPYTYAWNTNPAQSLATATNLPAGSWTCTVTDANGCSTQRVVTINQPASSLTAAVVSQQDVNCHGQLSGSATVSATGGSGPYAFVWNTTPVQTSATAVGLPAGTWTCTVTDVQGCTAQIAVTILGPNAPVSASLTSSTNVPCHGSATGSASVNATGGTAPLSFVWNTSPVQTGPTATGLAAGTWICTVTDVNGCSTSVAAIITQPSAPLQAAIASQTNVGCHGGTTGSASISVSGGTPPYTTAWNTSPAQTGTNVSGLPAGTWTCTVTDSQGCTTQVSVIITQPGAPLQAQVSAQQHVLCHGQATGSASISASGGTGTLSYSWNTIPVLSTATATGLPAGVWTCTVSDANGCTVQVPVTILGPSAPISISLQSTSMVACHGEATGQANVQITGGTPPHAITWNTIPAQTGTSASSLPVGTWTCTVVDDNGCIATLPVTITGPSAPIAVSAQIVTAACQGASDGGIDATITGGTPPLSIAWTGPNGFSAATEDLNALHAGVYTLIVSDANNCAHTSSWNVGEPGLFSVTATLSDHVGGYQVSCHGAQDGFVDLSVSGATAPYQHSWTGPGGFSSNLASINGLAAGTYIYTVTDDNGCSHSQTFILNAPAPLAVVTNAGDAGNGYGVSCHGGSNGSIDAVVMGGTAPWTLLWSGPGGFTANSEDIAGLSAGSYTLDVTDANGCFISQSTTITTPAALGLNIHGIQAVSCHGGDDGQITAQVAGGVAPIALVWNTMPAQSGPTASGLVAATYIVTATDANGCMTNAPGTITQPATPLSAALASVTPVLCFGEATGTATITVSGGTAPYSIAWNTQPSQSGPTATTLPAGTWTATVTDALGCMTSIAVVIQQPVAPLSIASNSIHQVTCHGGSDGSATMQISGGTLPYHAVWNSTPSQTGPQLLGVVAGSYTLLVTDDAGCTASTGITIGQPAAPLTLAIASVSPVSCYGSNSGQATVIAQGGTGPYTYSWNTAPVHHGATVNGLPPGTWTAFVTDANGCSASIPVVIHGPSGALSVSLVSTQNNLCFGGMQGSAEVAAQGGTAPYQFTWNTIPTQNGPIATQLQAGYHVVTVTDAQGCSSSLTVPVAHPATPVDGFVEAIQHVSCYGGNNGWAQITPFGGSGSYSIQWNTVPPQTGPIATGLAPGFYFASITDNNGCPVAKQVPVTIQGPATPLTGIAQLSAYPGGVAISCHQGQDGWIDITASGGTAPYTYDWTDPLGNHVPTQDLTGIAEGTYTLLITDANGCSVNGTYTLQAPAPITANAAVTTAACQGSADGTIDLTVNGGVAPYTYQWNGPGAFSALTSDISGLYAGVYSVMVTDANGCMHTTSFDVSQPGQFAISASLSNYGGGNEVSCAGAQDGWIDVTASGGTGSLTYDWTGPQGSIAQTEDITGLSAGTYGLTITDQNGCSTYMAYVLSAPDPIAVTLSAMDQNGVQIGCAGASDGSIHATIGGGTPGYILQWSGPNGFSSNTTTITGLATGTYLLTVTDANGCTSQRTTTLLEPAPLALSAQVGQFASGDAISCAGANDGSIDLSIQGGIVPYTVSWSGPNGFASTLHDPQGLFAGSYSATVTDANGCTAQLSITLSEPQPLALQLVPSSQVSGSAISCHGATDGSLELTISGGAGNAVAQWIGPNAFVSQGTQLQGLAAGTYQVTVLDQNGCIATAQHILDAPDPIQVTTTVEHAVCFGMNSGAIDITILGGASPFSTAWTGPGAFSSQLEDIDQLFAGVYTLALQDANGCVLLQPITVTQPGTFQAQAILSSYGGGFQVSCAGAMDGSIQVNASGGTAPYYPYWTGPDGFTATTMDIAGLAAGTYHLVLNDQNGCATLFSWTLAEPTMLNAGLLPSLYPGGSNLGCAQGMDGSINAIIAGGMPPYTLLWEGPQAFSSIQEDIAGLHAGTYTLSVTDVLGCTTSAQTTLVEPPPMVLDLDAMVFANGGNVSCSGAQDGSIDLTILGGTPPYLVTWSGSQGVFSNQHDPSGLAAGSYLVTVTDLNGCSAQASISLTAADPIVVTLQAQQFGNGFQIPCKDSAAGSITALVQGGQSPLTYLWTGPNGFSSSQQSISGLVAGTYTAIVSDASGCSGSASITLMEPPTIVPTASISDDGYGHAVSCTGNDGTIDLFITGGVQPLQVAWTGPLGFASTGTTLNGLAAGTYHYSIVDDNGCELGGQLTLLAPPALTAQAVPGSILCDGSANGSIQLTINGGVAPHQVLWTGPDGFNSTNEDPTGLAGGTYQVTITDAVGCVIGSQATIVASAPMDLAVYTSSYGGVNIACHGDSTGVIELLLQGGHAPVSIAWNGPDGPMPGTWEQHGLVAGDYQVSIVDANGCVVDTMITLSEPADPLTLDLDATVQPSGTNISCHGGSDGAIDATILSGIAPFTFDWRGPGNVSYGTEDLSGIPAGDYELVVIDANQCTATLTITLTEPDSALTVQVDPTIQNGGYHTSCAGSSDGSASLITLGGNGGNHIAWSGPNGFSSADTLIMDLVPGVYVVQVTDMNGCMATEQLEITAPPVLEAQTASIPYPGGSAISCAGANDGILSATILGGVGPYQFDWSGPDGAIAGSDTIAGLAPGSYCLLVTDANGCTATTCTAIIAPAPLQASTTTTDAPCGQHSGTVDLDVQGGSAPYTYTWSNGAVTQDLEQLVAGSYGVTITDANGCTTTVQTSVPGSAGILAQLLTADALCNGEANGAVDLDIISGTAPYTFLWAHGATDQDLQHVPAGEYTVLVTDAAGCTWTGSTNVAEPAGLEVQTSMSQYANGYAVSAIGAQDGSIHLQVQGGTPPYIYQWGHGPTTSQIHGLGAGTYTVTVTDANGCTRMVSVTLESPTDLVMPTGFTPNGDGSNDAYVIHGLDGYPENQVVIFNRWGNVVYERVNYRNDWRGENLRGELLPEGTYFVILTIKGMERGMQNYVDLRR